MIRFVRNILNYLNNSVNDLFNSKKKKQALNSKKNNVKTVDEWMSENNISSEEKESTLKVVKEKEIDDKTIIEELKRVKKSKKEKKGKEPEMNPQEFEKVTGFLANAKRNFTDEEFLERKIEVLQFLKELKNKKQQQ